MFILKKNDMESIKRIVSKKLEWIEEEFFTAAGVNMARLEDAHFRQVGYFLASVAMTKFLDASAPRVDFPSQFILVRDIESEVMLEVIPIMARVFLLLPINQIQQLISLETTLIQAFEQERDFAESSANEDNLKNQFLDMIQQASNNTMSDLHTVLISVLNNMDKIVTQRDGYLMMMMMQVKNILQVCYCIRKRLIDVPRNLKPHED